MNRPENYLALIKVVGVGGAGGNAINRMKNAGLSGVEYISINTDAQVLMSSEADQLICIGEELTSGLGAGGNPDVGKKAAEDDSAKIEEALQGADMVFIAVGEGGGTGTGAAPVIAEISKKLGSLTIAVATRPFSFEGERRKQIADQGIRNLKDRVDAQIVIPNDRLNANLPEETTLSAAFSAADEILKQSVQGITDLITRPGIINTDFADVKAILGNAGTALIGVGEASGEERGSSAARKAISNPLLEDAMQSARGIILNITGGTNPELGLNEVTEAADIVRGMAHNDANIIFGAVNDESMGEKMRVTVISAGFSSLMSDEWNRGYDAESILASLDENTTPPDFLTEDLDTLDLPDFLQ